MAPVSPFRGTAAHQHHHLLRTHVTLCFSALNAALTPEVANGPAGFSASTITIYWLALSVVLLAFVLALFFKTPTLRSKSALQEAAEEKHAASEAAASDEIEREAQRASDEAGVLV